MNMLIYGLSCKKNGYSSGVRKFCLRMQFHSNSAYKELRKFLSNHIPTVRTIQKWLRVVDTSEGITRIALETIAGKADSYREEGKQLFLTLISDEMSIMRHVMYDEHKACIDGFPSKVNSTNNGRRNYDEQVPAAKDVLVFMVVGPDFRTTVAHYFLYGLDAIDRAILTREVIRSVDETTAKIISITGDGLHANLSVAKLLGANFDEKKTYFP